MLLEINDVACVWPAFGGGGGNFRYGDSASGILVFFFPGSWWGEYLDPKMWGFYSLDLVLMVDFSSKARVRSSWHEASLSTYSDW